MIKAKYEKLCLNCQGEIKTPELLSFGICKNCLNGFVPKNFSSLFKILNSLGTLKTFKEIFERKKRFEKINSFFKKIFGQRMTSLQETWVKRVLMGKSFSIVAPPGLGKTVFGILTSLYFSTERKKSYLIVPTSLLVEQIREKIEDFSKILGFLPRFIAYSGSLSKKKKNEIFKKIENGEFEILVSTERFFGKNFELFKKIKFDFVFVDDVDSFLKSPKNIDKILIILGFNPKTVTLSSEILNLQREIKIAKKFKASPKAILKKIEKRILKIKKEKENAGVLVVSGATLKAKKSKKIKLFEIFLDFQLGFRGEFLRNLKDFWIKEKEKIKEKVLEILKNFGEGCLIFVPSTFKKSFLFELEKFLKENGIETKVYESTKEKVLKEFEEGKLKALIGFATFRSPLIRGIDLPERIRYVIFAGVPRTEIELDWRHSHPLKILTLLKNIQEFLKEKDQQEAESLILKLRRIFPLEKSVIQKVEQSLNQNIQLSDFENYVKNLVLKSREFLGRVIDQDLIEKIKQSKEISLFSRDGKFFLLISDPVAYLQGSARASRFFGAGISRGASILIVDDEKAFNSLREKIKILAEEVEWEKYKLEKMKEWFRKIDEDRKLIRKLREGEIKISRGKEFLKTALVVVESPTKAKTISRFFGRPAKRKFGNLTVFEVNSGKYILNILATAGHVFDLTVGKGFHGVEIENSSFLPIYDFIKKCPKCLEQFTGFSICPNCKNENIISKESIVEALRKIAQEVNLILVSTDPDIEGEKIAFDVFCALKALNKKIKRLEFHEITKKAFLEALNKKRDIDLNLVDAQIVRRIVDRWIGFTLSQKLWEKFKSKRLSAGRVQTPVLGWVIERTKEAREKKDVLFVLLSNNFSFYIESPKISLDFEEWKNVAKKEGAKIKILKEEIKKIFPLPPYTTDTLLKDANLILKFSSQKTMEIAQDLFECGLCTYHRTDSTTVSSFGLNLAKEYLKKHFPDLISLRTYKKEGAHECIRPTRPLNSKELQRAITLGLLRFPKRLGPEHFALYRLIFDRFLTSQMKEIEVLYQTIEISIFENKIQKEIPVEIKKEGFNKIFPFRTREKIKEGEYQIQNLKLLKVPKATLFTQGTLISMMKERGLGRPSTYSKIVSTLFEKNYVGQRKGKIFNTILGYKIYQYLTENFKEYVSEETTKNLEEILDKIEIGKEKAEIVLKNIYQEISKI